MANEIDLTKKVSDEAPNDSSTKKNADKQDKKSKNAKSGDGKSKKASQKPKKSIIKYFKDARAEFKKVVWPTPKATTNNTVIVLVVCAIVALFIFGIDSLFSLLNTQVLG